MENNPTVYTTQQSLIKNRPWFKTWRMVYVLFGIVLIVELVFGAKTLLAPLSKAIISNPQPLSGANLSLIASKSTYKVGETIPVRIKVWTGGYMTSGTDIILNYDPRLLEATTSSFIKGKIYSDYPLFSVDPKKGVVRISGAASSTKQSFSGAGEFGIVNLKARAKGNADLTIDFQKGQTKDSNVMGVSTNEDYLQSVKNLKLTIQ